jgi:hypothetical protein
LITGDPPRTWFKTTPHEDHGMSNTILRYLRLHCPHPTARPEPRKDGVLAVASINERSHLARLLLADMDAWGRNTGASVTNAIDRLMAAAHRHLISGFGIALKDTLVVELDGNGHFDLVCDLLDGQGLRHMPLYGLDKRIEPRTREAFLSWAGPSGEAMLAKAEAVASGAWAGVEG